MEEPIILDENWIIKVVSSALKSFKRKTLTGEMFKHIAGNIKGELFKYLSQHNEGEHQLCHFRIKELEKDIERLRKNQMSFSSQLKYWMDLADESAETIREKSQ